MRKLLCVLPILGAAAFAAYFLKPVATVAEPNKDEAKRDAVSATSGQLPISQVVLFSSGVGYFQREGTVEGNARVDLSFPVQDINDLLKSMVVRDLDGGVINTVAYDSNAPVGKTLKSFAINLSGNPAFAQILNQARGEKVEVVSQQANATQPGILTGSIVGTERQKQAAGKETVELELLNLWCPDGMRSLKMSEIQRVRFLNPLIDSEFKRALETLAQGHDTQKKTVSISCLGEGKRNIKVGYVVENPIWKTSYRLVLDKDKKEKPFLQGWAVVENPSDEDWKDVRMALVSGRPISFQMNLYDPLYVARPVVEPELFASLRPVAYSGRMDLNGQADQTSSRTHGATGNVLEIPKGQRAIAIKVNPESLAGGFILPGMRVDVICTMRRDGEPTSMTLLQNMRVIGLDTKITRDEGQTAALGQTATLAATPEECERLALAAQLGELRLVLRSADGRVVNVRPAKPGDLHKAVRERDPRTGEYIDAQEDALPILPLPPGGARSVASAAKLGDFFQYTIDKPVSLPRQKSAMLPIVNKDVEGARVSIYNERTQAKFPLLGLKLKNTSGLHLMQGPITVFEGANYAGDARILDLQPNEERLISYAVDLGTEVNPVP
jgi:hypothetical protein